MFDHKIFMYNEHSKVPIQYTVCSDLIILFD